MSQNREELEARIAAFIDGELPPDEAARLEVFLANTDTKLADQVVSMLGDKHALRQLPRMQAPADLSARIMDAVERTSLLHEVETFAAPKRPWWQSRSAIAAGLLIVLSGFTYVVIQSTLRNENGFHEFVEGRAAKSPALAALEKKEGIQNEALMDAGGARESAKDRAIAGKMASADSEIAPSLQELESRLGKARNIDEEVIRNQAAVQVPAEMALKNGFVEASTPLTALENVKAAPSKFVSGTPVLVTLVARDEADPQRLQSMLQEMIRQDAAASTQQLALNNRLNTYGNNYDSRLKASADKKASDYTANSLDYNVYNNTAGQFESQRAANTLVLNNAKEDNRARDNSEAQQGGEQQAGGAQAAKGQVAEGGSRENKYKEERGGEQVQQQQQQYSNLRGSGIVGNSNAGSGVAGNSTLNFGNNGLNNGVNFSAAAPYRIVLRADQLAQITETFQVNTITRGPAAYLIANAGNGAPATEQFAKAKTGLKQDWAATPAKGGGQFQGKGGGDGPALADASTNVPSAPTADLPAPGAAVQPRKDGDKLVREEAAPVEKAMKIATAETPTAQPTTSPARSITKMAEPSTPAMPAPATTSPTHVPGGASGNTAGNEQWVECIITMETILPSVQNRGDAQYRERSQRTYQQQTK